VEDLRDLFAKYTKKLLSLTSEAKSSVQFRKEAEAILVLESSPNNQKLATVDIDQISD